MPGESTDDGNDDGGSLFHRLPAELREMIYDYTFPLQGLHLHVWRRPGDLKEPYCSSNGLVFRTYPRGKEKLVVTNQRDVRYTHAECHAPSDDDYVHESTTISYDDAVGRPVWNWLERERHGRCYDRPLKRSFPVGLVTSCRLLYKETVALLYRGHTFCFHDSLDMNDFALGLAPQQRRLLRHIRMYCDTTEHSSPLGELSQDAVSVMDKLEVFTLTLGSAIRPLLQRTPRFRDTLRSVKVVVGPPYQKHLAGHAAHRNRPNAKEVEDWILSHRVSSGDVVDTPDDHVDDVPAPWTAAVSNPSIWPHGEAMVDY